jgi:hypothetical protein
MPTRALLSSQESRVQALKDRHAVLSNRIEEAHRSPSTTHFYLQQLKKQKLALKEEMLGIRESEQASA